MRESLLSTEEALKNEGHYIHYAFHLCSCVVSDFVCDRTENLGPNALQTVAWYRSYRELETDLLISLGFGKEFVVQINLLSEKFFSP